MSIEPQCLVANIILFPSWEIKHQPDTTATELADRPAQISLSSR
jgi:hypothetical protein